MKAKADKDNRLLIFWEPKEERKFRALSKRLLKLGL